MTAQEFLAKFGTHQKQQRMKSRRATARLPLHERKARRYAHRLRARLPKSIPGGLAYFRQIVPSHHQHACARFWAALKLRLQPPVTA